MRTMRNRLWAVVLATLLVLLLPIATFAEGYVEVDDVEVQQALVTLDVAIQQYLADLAAAEQAVADRDATIAAQTTDLAAANARIAELEQMLAEAEATITTYSEWATTVRAWQEVMPAAPGDQEGAD